MNQTRQHCIGQFWKAKKQKKYCYYYSRTQFVCSLRRGFLFEQRCVGVVFDIAERNCLVDCGLRVVAINRGDSSGIANVAPAALVTVIPQQYIMNE